MKTTKSDLLQIVLLYFARINSINMIVFSSCWIYIISILLFCQRFYFIYGKRLRYTLLYNDKQEKTFW